MKLPQMSWEFALQTCNLFTYYLDGRVLQLILGFSGMLFLEETGWWSLEVITIYVMLGIATVKDSWHLIESHPTAKGLRNKSFPHYDDLCAIFGKDRARGDVAEAPADAVEAMEEEATNGIQVHGLDDIEEDADANENVSHSYAPSEDASSSGRRTRKRARSTESSTLESLVGVMKNMGKLYEETSTNVAKIAKCFEIEAEWSSRRLNVFEEVSKVEGFSDGDMLRAGEILSRDAARANYFFTLPHGLRKLYLQGLLSSNN